MFSNFRFNPPIEERNSPLAKAIHRHLEDLERKDALNIDSEFSVNFYAAGTGATLRRVQDKLRERVSILDFVEPGTTPSDYTTALNNALASGTYVEVFIPSGTYSFDGTVTVPIGCAVRGAGRGATVLSFTSSTAKFFSCLVDDIEISDLTIESTSGVSGVSGCIGIYTRGVGTDTCSNFQIRQVTVSGLTGTFYNGIVIDGTAGCGTLVDVKVNNCESDGIIGKSAQGYWVSVNSLSNKGHGVKLTPSSPGGGVPPWITGLQTFANGGWDVWTDNGILMVNSFLNNSSQGNLYIGSSASVDGGYVAHCNLQFAGLNPFNSPDYPVVNTAPALKFDTSSPPTTMQDIHIFNAQGNGIEVDSDSQNIIGGLVLGSGQGAQAGHTYGALVGSAGNGFTMHGIRFDKPVKTSGSRINWIGNKFLANDALPAVYIAAGTQCVFDANEINNAGAGNAFTADVGVTLCAGANMFRTGTVTNNATITGTRWYSSSDAPTFDSLTVTNAITAARLIVTGSTIPANGVYLSSANTLAFATNTTKIGQCDASGKWTLGAGFVAGWGGGTTGEIANVVGANSALGNGGNARIISSTSQAADLGGALTFGGYYTAQTNSIDFVEISGRKENGTGGNTAGYLVIATRVGGGNMTEAVRITSGQITRFGTMPTWSGGTTGEKVDIIAANSTLGNGGNLRVITNDSQAIDKGGAITLGGYRTGTTSAIDFAEVSGRKENGTDTNTAGYLVIATRVGGGNMTEALRISSAQDATFKKQVVSVGATSGIGYATGAGGTQTQLTSKSTTVTLNTVCGEITMHNATLNANTTVSFTLTNSAVAATDNLLCVHASGGTVGSYMIHGRGAGAGSATITVRNITAGNLGEAIVIRFTVLKGVTS